MKNMTFNCCAPLRYALTAFCSLQFLLAPHLNAQEIAGLPELPTVEIPSDTFSLPEPISITNANGAVQLLQGMEDGQLRFSFPNMPGAEAIIPITGRDFQVILPLPANYNRSLLDYDRKNYRAYLAGMRSTAEPLARFLGIPASQTNIHGVFNLYYKVFTAVGDLDEAVELTFLIPWDSVPQDYLSLVPPLVYRTISEGAFDQTERLLSLLNQSLTENDFAEMAFGIADALRTASQHTLATRVYGSLAKSDNPSLREKSLLWAGYSRSVDGDPVGAREILDRVDELERDDRNFLTYCLALGRLGYAEENVRDGLRYLARAMVLTAVDATFKPELYYLVTSGYLRSGNEVAANRLAAEFEIFFPDSPWMLKYQSEMENASNL